MTDQQSAVEAMAKGMAFAETDAPLWIPVIGMVAAVDERDFEIIRLRTTLAEREAEIAKLKAERAWRPMESAPRNGTPVWLYIPGQQTEAWFGPGEASQDHEGCDNGTGPVWVCADDQWQIEVEWTTDENGNDVFFDGNATHWLPLPPAPEAT